MWPIISVILTIIAVWILVYIIHTIVSNYSRITKFIKKNTTRKNTNDEKDRKLIDPNDHLNKKYECVNIGFKKLDDKELYLNTLIKNINNKNFIKAYRNQLQNYFNSKLKCPDLSSDDEKLINENLDQIKDLKYIKDKLKLALYDSEYGLCSIIGHTNLKEKISYIILSFTKNYKTFSERSNNILLLGDSGVGKTKSAQVIGFALCNSMLLLKNNTVITTSTDLIAQYVGHTAIKTRDLIKESHESVLFIDEAYALGYGSADKNNGAFAKEAVTELVAQLDKLNGKIIVICAGYDEDMMDGFLRANQGLARRFPNNIKLSGFDEKEMSEIFIQRMKKLDENIEITQDDRNSIYSYFIYLKKLVPNKLNKHADSVIERANDTYSKMLVMSLPLKEALKFSFNILNF